MYLVLFLLMIIPPWLLLGLPLAGVIWTWIGFRGRRVQIALLTAAGGLELAVLVVWSTGTTAAGAFQYGGFDVNRLVLPPELETTLMRVFWAGLCVPAAGLVIAWAWRLAKADRFPGSLKGLRARAPAIVLLAFTALCIRANHLNLMRMHGSLGRSMSPDGRTEVSLVPINCFVDTNGLLIYRKTGAFWWRTAATIGDQLTLSPRAQFQWPSASEVVVIVGDEASATIDFSSGRAVPR